jgi:ribosomal biogenesis protein LAS1
MPIVHFRAIALLKTLCSDNPHLETTLSTLLQFSKDTSTRVSTRVSPTSESLVSIFPQKWCPDDLDTMKQRLNSLASAGAASESSPVPTRAASAMVTVDTPIPGWHLLDQSGWRPCPIGVHYATTTCR